MVEAITTRLSSIRLRVAAFSPSSAKAQLENRLSRVRMSLDSSQRSIMHSMENALNEKKALSKLLRRQLEALSPLAVMQRGYAIISSGDGKSIRRAFDAKPGQDIDIRLSDGIIKAGVKEVKDGGQ